MRRWGWRLWGSMMGKENKNIWKKIIGLATMFGGVYLVLKSIARNNMEGEDINAESPYIDGAKASTKEEKAYERLWKSFIDRILAFAGLLVLAPLFVIISVAIFVDDPGTVLFKQKRVGKGKELFYLHKFRSMKMSTPHDVPTHQLSDPESYITRVGKVLRRTSLDELPQIWDIFRGRMSIIGPRPALWNQEDLVAEREKYGANGVLPGLTGWAQINGRDELEISEKAKLDGEYVEHLRQGGVRALFFDVRCFFGTVKSVIGGDGVVEGGTGEIYKSGNFMKLSVNDMYKSASIPIRGPINKDNSLKRILVVGTGSYIGDSLKKYLNQTEGYEVCELDSIDLIPKPSMFKGVDSVFYVAGIAHRKETKENEALYYQVNRDLAINVAKAAKIAEVPHIIILSSMAVYGIGNGFITKRTKANPKTYYGSSKLQADIEIWKMRDKRFRVAIFRPPMVYGKGCKGNYNLLRKLAIRTPVFPRIKNERSMIYIGNLCEFAKRVIDDREEGIFFPQNSKYVCTSEMVELISTLNGKHIKLISLFNFLIYVLPVKTAKKVFGNLRYEMCDPVQKYNFRISLEETENVKDFYKL